MTIFDMLGSIGIGIGIELLIVLFFLIKYLICFTRYCDEEDEICYCDDCACEHGGEGCCREIAISPEVVKAVKVQLTETDLKSSKIKKGKGK